VTSRAAAVCSAALSFACATSYLNRAPPSPDSAPRSTSGGRHDFSLPPLASSPAPAEEATADFDRVYGLPDLIDIGESTNPDTRIEWEKARQAALTVGLARAEYLPTISALALGGFQRTWLQVPTTSSTVTVGPTELLPGVSFPLPAVTGSRHLGVDSFDLLPFLAIRWQLLDFGRSAGVEAAENASVAANVSFSAAHQRVVFEVTRAYLRLNAARAQSAVARDALQRTRAIAKGADARRDRGLATTVEVSEARREVAQDEYSLAQAQASETAVYTALLATLGLDPLTRLNVATISSRELPEHLDDSVDSYLRAALRTRPDLQAAVAMRSSAQAMVSKSQASFLPRMSLSGTAGAGWLGAKAEGAPWTTATVPNLGALMTFEWTLFDFGARDAQTEIARSRSNQAEQMVEKVQRQATQEVVAAYDDANANLVRYKAAASLEWTAAVAEDAVTKAYANGLKTITDTLSAQKARSLASAGKEQAFSEALIAATALVFASGQLGSADAVPDFRK
jgi:outer membrane protein